MAVKRDDEIKSDDGGDGDDGKDNSINHGSNSDIAGAGASATCPPHSTSS